MDQHMLDGQFSRAVCRVEDAATGEPHGTAFFVLPGVALTCVHVSRRATRLQLASDHLDGGPWPATVRTTIVNQSTPWPDLPSYPDIAVLDVAFSGYAFLPLATSHPALSTAVVCGYPRVAGAVVLTSCHAEYDGKLSHDDSTWLWKLKATEITAGMSGGPAFDGLTGMVFGLTIATRGERYASGGIVSPIVGVAPVIDDIIRRNRELQLTGKIGSPSVRSPGASETKTGWPAAPRFFHVPETTGIFVGRASDLAAIDDLLREGDPGLSAVAITGLGGVGKTELAAQYAHMARSRYSFVWWFTAADRAALLDEYTSLAPSLGIQRDGIDAEVTVVQVRERVEQTDQPWLLVFDNADDPRILAGFVPSTGRGDIIITSRYADWNRSRVAAYKLNQLSAADGGDLLVASTGQQDTAGAASLAEQLGGLALALQQASALLARSGWTYARFSDLLRQRSRDLLSMGPARSFAGSHAMSVYNVWEHSIDRAVAQAPYARDVLQILALLAAERIPRGIVASGETSLAGGDEIAGEASLLALADYSLVDLSADTVSLHRLVQEVELANMRESHQIHQRAMTVGKLLVRLMPSDPDDCDTWGQCAEVVPHILNISGLLDPETFRLEPVARAESLAGCYLNSRGSRHQARDLLVRSVSRLADRPDEHAATLSDAEMNLARVERNLGDLASAVVHAAESRDLAQRLTDPQPLAASLSMLGRVLMDSGDVDGAQAAYDQALELVSDGPLATSRLTVAVLNHAGRALMRGQAFDEAERLLRKAMEIDQALHPRPHADTAWTLDNLAMARFALGDMDQAEIDLRRVLDIEAGIHGADHPRSAWSLRNLARVIMSRGDPMAARSLLLRSLVIIDKATPNNRTEIVATARALSEVCDLIGDRAGRDMAVARMDASDGPPDGPAAADPDRSHRGDSTDRP